MQQAQSISTSTIQEEGLLKASKYQRVQALFSKEELKALFDEMESFYIVEQSKLLFKDQLLVTKDVFLKRYEMYLESLLLQNMPREALTDLSVCFSSSLESFYKIETSGDKFLVKQRTPAILVQPFSFHFDSETKQIFTGVHSGDRIFFGLEFSFPQFYETPKTRETVEILKDKENKDTFLFKTIQKFARRNTKPAKIFANGESKNYSFRVGSECQTLISNHKALLAHSLSLVN